MAGCFSHKAIVLYSRVSQHRNNAIQAVLIYGSIHIQRSQKLQSLIQSSSRDQEANPHVGLQHVEEIIFNGDGARKHQAGLDGVAASRIELLQFEVRLIDGLRETESGVEPPASRRPCVNANVFQTISLLRA